jgi:hypothetical protein
MTDVSPLLLQLHAWLQTMSWHQLERSIPISDYNARRQKEVLTDSLMKLRALMCQGRSDMGSLRQLLAAASSDDHIGENEGACAVHLHR